MLDAPVDAERLHKGARGGVASARGIGLTRIVPLDANIAAEECHANIASSRAYWHAAVNDTNPPCDQPVAKSTGDIRWPCSLEA
jgi:hypothetical protein